MVKLRFLLPVIIALAPIVGHAQYLGQVNLQTVTQEVFPNIGCAPVAVNINNIGQTTHYLIYKTSGTITAFAAQFEATDDNVNWLPVGQVANDTAGGTITATFYAPKMRIHITACTGTGTIFGFYSGTQVAGINGTSGTAGPTPTTFICNKIVPFNFTGTSGRIIQSSSTTTTIHICQVSFSLSAAETLTFEYGTGAVCGTGTTTQLGPYPQVLAMALDGQDTAPLTPVNAAGTVVPGQDICLVVGSSATVGGGALYAEF